MKLKLSLCSAALAVLALSTASLAIPRYSVTVIDHYSLENDLGQSVFHVGDQISNTPYLFDHGSSTAIPCPWTGEYATGWARDINNLGQVVGEYGNRTHPTHAFLWQSGQPSKDLGTLGGQWSRAVGINDSSVITGTSATNEGHSHACLWNGANLKDLGTLPGFDESSAIDINNRNQVIGELRVGGIGGFGQAFIWENNNMTLLSPPHGQNSWAADINNNGQIVGGAVDNNRLFACLWDTKTNTARDLDALPGYTNAEAIQITDSGIVLGYCYYHTETWDDVRSDCLWEGSNVYDLKTLINDPGYEITTASMIRNDGSIVAYGRVNGEMSVLLLTPVPEPSGAIALIGSLGGMLGLALRRRK